MSKQLGNSSHMVELYLGLSFFHSSKQKIKLKWKDKTIKLSLTPTLLLVKIYTSVFPDSAIALKRLVRANTEMSSRCSEARGTRQVF